MFNGLMDPELMRLAQEQMSRMSPADFAKIQQQMMCNPDLMRMATESMKNMRPEDLRHAVEQLKYTQPEDIAEIGEKMANASPEEISAIRARFDAQVTYELNAAQMLKKQGNELHSQGRFSDAMEKYLLAKKNLKGVLSAKGKPLLLACSLNLMSCYLKTSQFDKCIKEGSEVLAYEPNNVKALYRRGQAYKELGLFEDAVSDLVKACEVSSDDETIADVLRDAKERLAQEGRQPRKLVIEEIAEEVATAYSETHKIEPTNNLATNSRVSTSNASLRANDTGEQASMMNSVQALKDDPEAIRSFQNFISTASPETLASISGGKAEEVSPEMFKTASKMISRMSPEELQKMVQMASAFHGENPSFDGNLSKPGHSSVPPNMSPDMFKTANDMISKMSPEDLQKMFEMASSLRGKNLVPAAEALNTDGQSSDARLKLAETRENLAIDADDAGGQSSSSSGLFSGSGNSPQPNFPNSAIDMQEQMRNQMKDPAMRQMFASMIKNMSPEMMANMSEQFGMKLSREETEKAQQAMSSLSPEDLDRMMRWADKIQKGAEGAKKAKNWLLGKRGMILAILMLILAMILHWLGFIGR